MNRLHTKEENRRLIERFPFLRMRDPQPDGEDLAFTWMDMVPEGWRIAFGEPMCQEILEELVATGCLDDYRIVEIKEKWGGLRWYDEGGTERLLMEILRKYEILSTRICIECGKPATRLSKGWISPYCEEHAPKDSEPI